MSTPLGEIHRPEAERFRKGRKVYLVPLFLAPPGPPDDLKERLERYWSGAQEHVARLEAALGPVNRIYHEAIFLPGEEGEKLVEQLNPGAFPLIRARCQAGAQLEATEDRALVEESSDWQRCLYVGLISEKASSIVLQAYLEVINQRYQHISSRINDTLQRDESAILVIGDNHRVQFPADIEVFYVAPPALNDLRRWLDDRLRRPPQAQSEGEGVQANE